MACNNFNFSRPRRSYLLVDNAKVVIVDNLGGVKCALFGISCMAHNFNAKVVIIDYLFTGGKIAD